METFNTRVIFGWVCGFFLWFAREYAHILRSDQFLTISQNYIYGKIEILNLYERGVTIRTIFHSLCALLLSSKNKPVTWFSQMYVRCVRRLVSLNFSVVVEKLLKNSNDLMENFFEKKYYTNDYYYLDNYYFILFIVGSTFIEAIRVALWRELKSYQQSRKKNSSRRNTRDILLMLMVYSIAKYLNYRRRHERSSIAFWKKHTQQVIISHISSVLNQQIDFVENQAANGENETQTISTTPIVNCRSRNSSGWKLMLFCVEAMNKISYFIFRHCFQLLLFILETINNFGWTQKPIGILNSNWQLIKAKTWSLAMRLCFVIFAIPWHPSESIKPVNLFLMLCQLQPFRQEDNRYAIQNRILRTWQHNYHSTQSCEASSLERTGVWGALFVLIIHYLSTHCD